MSTAAAVRPQIAVVVDGLEEVSRGLRMVATATTSEAEKLAFHEAANDAEALAKRLRVLIRFAGPVR